MAVINFNAKKSENLISFEELTTQAQNLTAVSGQIDYEKILDGLIKLKLDAIQTETILSIVAKQIGHNIKIVRRAYKDLHDASLKATDFGLMMAKKTLTDFYGTGAFLKRNIDGLYFVFDKTHWRATSTDTIRKNIQKVITTQALLPKKTLAAMVGETMQCFNDLLASDEDLLAIGEAAGTSVNCKNMEVHLRNDGSVQLKPHNPLRWNFSCLDFDYNPEATCPIFDKTLKEIFSKSENPDDMVRHMEEIFGYAISGQRNIAMFILMVGHGRNGKSKVLETLQRLIGSDAVLSDSLASFQNDKFNMAALHGKLLFCDDDLEHGIKLKDGTIKKLSESKQVSARHPYGKKKFLFNNKALVVIASNDYPISDDISPGLIRRAYAIPFDRQFTEQEDNQELFPNIWKNEMSGILNRALQGLQRLKQRGAFLQPEDCKRANKEFLAHANPLYAFLHDCCEKVPGAKMRVKDVRDYFAAWAKEQGISINKEDKKFRRKLRALQNEFGYTMTEESANVAYPMIYGFGIKDNFICEL